MICICLPQVRPGFYETRLKWLLDIDHQARTADELCILFNEYFAEDLKRLRGKTFEQSVHAILSKIGTGKKKSNIIRKKIAGRYMYTTRNRKDIKNVLMLAGKFML